MTVSYQYEVTSSTGGGFTRLMFLWKGSLYKLIYRELGIFLICFALVSAIYRYALTSTQKASFEQIAEYCDAFIKLIPLSFILGFYVTFVAARWWQQYMALPWPDKIMHLVALYVTGNDEYSRIVRRSLMRYLNVTLILVLRTISSAVKLRFPTLDHVVDAGFLTPLELELFQSVPSAEFNTYWIPCTWFINLLKEARKNHRLPDSPGLATIMQEFAEFRAKCGLLWSYDWVSIPLVYTQVVTLATYSYFLAALIGRQYVEDANKVNQIKLDIYIPLYTIVEFLFYMGLLKVAEQLINPFGDDDEDFELNWLIDRHLKVSYLGVDILMGRCPPLVKDIYFDSNDLILPYTEAAAAYKRKTYRGSVANMSVPEDQQNTFLPDIIEEQDNGSRATPRPTPRSSIAGSGHGSARCNSRASGSHLNTQASRTSDAIIRLDINDSSLNADSFIDHRSNRSMKSPKSVPWSEANKYLNNAPTPKVNIQPWPSATNLEEMTSEILSMQSSSPFINIQRPAEDYDLGPKKSTAGFLNSAFSHEHLLNVENLSLDSVIVKNVEDNNKTAPGGPAVRRQANSTGSFKRKKNLADVSGRKRTLSASSSDGAQLSGRQSVNKVNPPDRKKDLAVSPDAQGRRSDQTPNDASGS